jgi:hypothetical protein
MKFAWNTLYSFSGAEMENDRKMDGLERTSGELDGLNDHSPNCGGGIFEIRVNGHLNSRWSEWLDGMEVKLLDNGEMVLIGPIEDQAALMGLLNKLNRLNLNLLSVNEVMNVSSG